ncbi:MAG TPA: D-alanyl-D-alanine carboxypeptidase family protein [Acidisoma sp.]|uniref:D-alanyl-D-alanine carboxypeptidase family protein n=1 Tax=Acidisoma sp. TaxID=1872115 RepID=UPI002B740078|nr:D-alanyl-D-alanine carboxypeptidase family protein [Acidisoma sp.]HTI03347.1 D-alanyl-D-alanine carboxypeptidase family protein [Acidisoma sp.]
MAREHGILGARLTKIAVALCALAILALAPKPSRAALPPMSAVMIDAKTGQTLYSQNANAPRYPASLTKLMTLYLLFEALRDNRITLNEMMPVSVHAASVEPVKLGARPGSRITVQEAILGMVTLSANDAATIAGEFLAGGDETRFGALMTLKAHSLGMTHTVFHNASGLPDPAQVTTAHDLAILARRLVEDFPEDYHYFSTPSFVFHGRLINNHDHLLKSYPGADGMKTGYTNAAGHNLVTSAVRGGVRLIGVVMAAPSNSYRDHQMAMMLDQGFADELGGNARIAMVNAATAARQAQAEATPVVPASDPTVAQARRQIASNASLGRADWNLDLGNYSSKSAAYTALRIARREAQGGVVHLVTLRTKSRHPAWHAWVAAVSENHAHATCSAMNHYGRTCVAVRPGAGRRNREIAER